MIKKLFKIRGELLGYTFCNKEICKMKRDSFDGCICCAGWNYSKGLDNVFLDYLYWKLRVSNRIIYDTIKPISFSIKDVRYSSPVVAIDGESINLPFLSIPYIQKNDQLGVSYCLRHSVFCFWEYPIESWEQYVKDLTWQILAYNDGCDETDARSIDEVIAEEKLLSCPDWDNIPPWDYWIYYGHKIKYFSCWSLCKVISFFDVFNNGAYAEQLKSYKKMLRK